MVALADDSVQVRLTPSLIRANALLENALRLFDELSVKVDAVGFNAAGGIILAEDVVGRLMVVFLHLGIVGLALVGQFLCSGTVAIFVSAARLEGTKARQSTQSRLGFVGRRDRRLNVHAQSSRRACQLRHEPVRADGRTRALPLRCLRGERLSFWSVNCAWAGHQVQCRVTSDLPRPPNCVIGIAILISEKREPQ